MIPFNVPYVPEISKRYALEAMESNHQQGDGPFTKKVSSLLSRLVGNGYVLLTPSCTHALEMASMLMNLGPGDEVIMPSFNFTSAATSVTKFGAKPVFVDIDPVTKCIDVNQTADAINSRTKAISWVNYAGAAPDMEALKQLSRDFNLLLVEDNAHGLGGSYRGKPLGSFGHFATQSFHATKNFQCGEGGALIINDRQFIERAEIIREKGTDRSRFIRGEVQKYQWVDHGSSYLLAEVLAAVLLGQLESYDYIQGARSQVYSAYMNALDSRLPEILTSGNSTVFHIFYLQLNNENLASAVIDAMSDAGISVVTHYQPLSSSNFGKHYPSHLNSEPSVSEIISRTLLRLPLWVGLPLTQINMILEILLSQLKPEGFSESL